MMRSLFTLCLGVMLGACVTGHGSQPIPELKNYPHYVLEPNSGMLLGKEPKDDLPVSVCAADATSKAKCDVMMHDVFTQLLKDMADYRERLIACEASH